MSIKATGIRLSEINKQRMKALIPNKSFNDIVEQLLDAAESPKANIDPKLKKDLFKKFRVSENADIEAVIKEYLINDKETRIKAINSTVFGSELIKAYGTAESTLDVVEAKYMTIHEALDPKDGKLTLTAVANALKLMAAGTAAEQIKAAGVTK